MPEWGQITRPGKGTLEDMALASAMLLKMCATHDLIISNTLFRLPIRNKTSSMHPRSRHWHLIDYVNQMVLLPKWVHAKAAMIFNAPASIVEYSREYSQAAKEITERQLYSVRTPSD